MRDDAGAAAARRLRPPPARAALRPLLAAAAWRVRILAALLAVDVALRLSGVAVPAPVSGALVVWLLAGLTVAPVLRASRRRGRDTLLGPLGAAAAVFDLTAQLYIYVHTGGGAWMAACYYLFIAFAANATLRRRYGIPVTAYAAALCFITAFAEAAGWVRGSSAFGASPLVGNFSLAAYTAAVSATLVLCAAVVQQSLMVATRRAGVRHRLVLESATDMIFTLDRGLRFDTYNAAVSRDLGLGREALAGEPFGPLLLADDAPRALAHLEAALAGAERRFDTRFRRRDGAVRWLAMTASPVREGHDVESVLVVARDVTDARAAEEDRARMQSQLAQSQKMEAVGQLVSGVAHELNNPLAAVLTFTEELLAEARRPADEQALRTIYEQAQRARTIVRDLRAFVRQGGGGSERARPIDVVERVVRGAGKKARDARATVEVVVAPDAPVADAPPSALEQVVANLLLNAIYAVGDAGGGQVRVRVGAAGDRCEIVVEDSGRGIPADVLPHIFEPFFTTKPTGQGTGLGLSVSLGVVEQYGGTLTVEDRPAPDVGTRFVVRLPALDPSAGIATTSEYPTPVRVGAVGSAPPARAFEPPAAAAAVPPAPAAASVAPTSSAVTGAAAAAAPGAPRVLVVDDEESIRLALRRFFTRRGWAFDDAGNGAEALARLSGAASDAYTAILCDLKMPGLSGPEFYAELERSAPHWLDRLILSTGDVASADAASFLAQARCPVLEKPFELTALAAAVDALRAQHAAGG